MIVPLSAFQESLFFLYLVHPSSAFYNNAAAVRLRGNLRVEVLQLCIDEIVRRHGALRAFFRLAGGEPLQEVDPNVRIPLRLVDLAAIPPQNRLKRGTAIGDRGSQKAIRTN
jgi:hypothetical protein